MTKTHHVQKRNKKERDRLMDRLFAAAQTGQEPIAPAPDINWHAEVMRAVRRIGPLSGSSRHSGFFGYLAWRLAPAALVLIVVLSVLVLQTGTTIDHQLVGMAVTDPADAYVSYIPF